MKTMLVGAGSGIAREVALLLGEKGEELVLIGREQEELLRNGNDLMVRFRIAVQLGVFDVRAAPNEAMRRALAECGRVIIAVGGLGDEKHYSGVLELIETATAVFEQRGHGSIAVLSSEPAKPALDRLIEHLGHTHARVKFTLVKLGPVDTEEMLGRSAALMISPHAAARGVLKAIRQNKRLAYVPARWRPIIAVVRRLPKAVVDRVN